jgi:hypothetical protein
MIQIGTDFTWSPPRSSSAWMILRILSIPPAGNPEDVDLTLYGLRKWAALACKGNPSVLHFFFETRSRPPYLHTRMAGDRDCSCHTIIDWIDARSVARRVSDSRQCWASFHCAARVCVVGPAASANWSGTKFS